MLETRRVIHANPELGNAEKRTGASLATDYLYANAAAPR